MRRVSLPLSGLLITCVIGSLTPEMQVNAGGQRRCSHKGVSTVDAEKLRPIATRTAAGHRLDWSTLDGCTHSGGAWANVDIVNEPQGDGSVIHGAAWCTRGRTGTWDCDYASGRGYRMSLVINGVTRILDTSLPDQLPVAAASKVMQQAIEIAPGLKHEQLCGYESDSRNAEYETMALGEIHRDFRFAGDSAYARISRESDGSLSVMVVLNYYLSFSPATPAGETFRFSCWDIAIIA